MKKVIFVGVLAILSDSVCAMDPSLTLITENNSSGQPMRPVNLSDVQINENEITVNSSGKQVIVQKLVDIDDGLLYEIEAVKADIATLQKYTNINQGADICGHPSGIKKPISLNTGTAFIAFNDRKGKAQAAVSSRIKYLQEAIAVAERNDDKVAAAYGQGVFDGVIRTLFLNKLAEKGYGLSDNQRFAFLLGLDRPLSDEEVQWVTSVINSKRANFIQGANRVLGNMGLTPQQVAAIENDFVNSEFEF